MSLAPPPEDRYDSREELLRAAKDWAANNGYAITIARSNAKKGVVYLQCDRGGSYRNRHHLEENQRRRKTGSRLTGCPFSAVGTSVQDVWFLRVREKDHNHDPSAAPTAHPSLRRFDEGQMEEIRQLSRVGAQPRTIVAALRGEGTNISSITARDVYNARVQIRAENLAGKTPIQTLIEELEEKEFVWEVKTNEAGRITHLFFAPRQGLALYQAYPEVPLLDCTYKTNKFKMPLLNVVGFTGLNTTFYVAFAFLRGEKEEDYNWALQKLRLHMPAVPRVIITDCELALINTIDRIFPEAKNLLCQWHIQKNILGKCKRYFSAESDDANSTLATEDSWTEFQRTWSTVVRTQSAAEFDTAWQNMKATYRRRIFAIQYIETIWLPLKERFACPWADQHRHYGTIVTSRVESAHATIKRYLEVFTVIIFEKNIN